MTFKDRIVAFVATARAFAKRQPLITRRILVWLAGGVIVLAAKVGLHLDAEEVVLALATFLGLAEVPATASIWRKVTPEADLLDPHA